MILLAGFVILLFVGLFFVFKKKK
ncbi:MAG: LPXTG cell wall anchor domain-containing protein [Alphaproteobacteria bacterium]